MKNAPPPATTSPLDDFADAICQMAIARKMLQTSMPTDQYRIMLEDLAMMTQEGMVIGIRDRWVRRVAVPMFKAWQAIHQPDRNEQERANVAMEILDQLGEAQRDMRVACQTWIRTVFLAPKPAPEAQP